MQFAPRDRATKVNLPGRIGKTSFNAYDAAAVDTVAAPMAAEQTGPANGLSMSVTGYAPLSGVGRRTSISATRQVGAGV